MVTNEDRVILLIHEAAHRYRGMKGNVTYLSAAYVNLTAKQAIDNADSYAVFAVQMHAARPKSVREAELQEAQPTDEQEFLEADLDRFGEDLEADDYNSAYNHEHEREDEDHGIADELRSRYN